MKYEVSAHVTISLHCVIEAKSKGDAVKQAMEADMMSLCGQCADGAYSRSRGLALNEWRTSGELDGQPKIIGVEKYDA